LGKCSSGGSFHRRTAITTEELASAKRVQNSRLNPFLEGGFVRLGGRLQCADLTGEERHPLVLDGAHRLTELLILQTHIQLHHFDVRVVLSHLRNEFWFLRVRQAIKRVLHTFLVCKMMMNPRGQQIEVPLLSDRVKPS